MDAPERMDNKGSAVSGIADFLPRIRIEFDQEAPSGFPDDVP